METICILFNARPDWASAKILLGDTSLMKKMISYDKVIVSLVPRLHCPAFFALWKSTARVFPKCKKNAEQWSLGMSLAIVCIQVIHQGVHRV